jgi:hypothetical protein
LARILLETGAEAPNVEAYRGDTSGGDTQRLRGLLAIARGVSWHVRGTNPTDCIRRVGRERRRRL